MQSANTTYTVLLITQLNHLWKCYYCYIYFLLL